MSRATRLRGMMRWLCGGDGQHPALRLASDGDGAWRAEASRPLDADDLILEVPGRFLITTETARESPIGRAIVAARVEPRNDHTSMAAFLLQERADQRSFWNPYIAAMPRAFPGHPWLFSAPELAMLRGSFTLELLRSRRDELQAEYEDLCARVPGFARFSWLDFLWARLAVLTRIFAITVRGIETKALIPLADMLNHRQPRETSWTYDDERRTFVVTALQPFAPGEAVHDSYGRKSNGRLFVNYGFCLEENRHDEAVIVLDRIPFRVRAAMDDEGAERMFEHLGIGRNGTAALIALVEACHRALGAFETTIEEDDALLRGNLLSPNARNAVLTRRSEKRVLRFHLRWAREQMAKTAVSRPSCRSST